jgi:hypothetical protein
MYREMGILTKSMNRPTAICLSLLALLWLCSCGSAPSTNGNQQNSATGANTSNAQTGPNDDVEELRASMQIPYEPEEAMWRVVTDKAGKKRLIAVLRLKPEDYKALSAKAAASGPGRPVQASVEQWFPAELIAMSETTGQMNVPATSYPADEFFQAPFDTGTVSLVNDTDYVIVELQPS